ncbi:hypothetical protein [Brachyspira murdochii]|uniref:Uncharacterized protein n=1 Tax=Brachyspira murdochii TaxID=84378 RepID=A0ABX5B7A6_9SPIR|nr:hypothetical protein [Brachyspira murdochii]PPS22037.1 hypothetical protein DJ52_07265 [Brachyspira murdochii]
MNYNKDDILRVARDYMKKIEISNKDTIDSILDKLKKLPEDGVAKITNYLKNLNQAVSNHEEGVLGIIKEAWNLHEEKREVLSLEDCISMIKGNINPKEHSAACIFLKSTGKNSKHYANYEIHVFYMDHNNNPMINGNSPHWIIYTNELSKDLSEEFGNGDMIVLK